MRVTRFEFTHTYGYGGTVNVPAGARVTKSYTPDKYWVDPSIYPSGSLERHDAEYRGILVDEEDTIEIDPGMGGQA